MTNSIEDEVETSIAYAITSAGVTGVNVYTSERATARLLPFVSVDAEIRSEESNAIIIFKSLALVSKSR